MLTVGQASRRSTRPPSSVGPFVSTMCQNKAKLFCFFKRCNSKKFWRALPFFRQLACARLTCKALHFTCASHVTRVIFYFFFWRVTGSCVHADALSLVRLELGMRPVSARQKRHAVPHFRLGKLLVQFGVIRAGQGYKACVHAMFDAVDPKISLSV